MAEERVQRRLAAILAADVVGYSRLMGEDEPGTRARFNAHLHELIEPAIASRGGRIVKTMGDGLLVEFTSVVDAVQCAVDIQKGMADRNADETDDRRIEFRIGVNLGDVIIEGDDIHGDGVNVASRLEGLAEPGGICVSGDVYRQCRGKLDVGFDGLGQQEVKNIAEPVFPYRVLPEGQTATAPLRKRMPSRWRIPAIAAAVVVVIAAGGIAWWQPWVTDVEPALIDKMAFKLPDRPSIAVLPFTNMSDDKAQEYFADGLTEDIITNLASFPNLFVIARHSTNKFKGKAVDIRDVAHDLGVRYVLEGSVRRAGNTVRITAQLIDALSGNHIWGNKYDRELKDIFALQDEITGEIGSRLVSKVARAEWLRRTRKGTRSAEAYDLFLRGSDTLWELNPRANARAIPLIEQAIEKDPKFARAYAFLALLRRSNALFGWAKGPQDTFKHALELAQKAVALDPRDSQTHRILGIVYNSLGQYDRAMDAVEKSIALSPSNPEGLITLAFTLAFAGRGEDAVRQAETAMRLNPHAPWYYSSFAGFAYYMAKQFDKAATSFDRARRLNPRSSVPIRLSAIAYAQVGNMEKARAAREEFLKIDPEFSIRVFFKRAAMKGEFKRLILEGYRKAGFPENPPLKLPDKL